MKLKIFAVYDSAVGAYLQPFFMQSKGQAIRGWLDAANDPKSQFNAHPSDFTLFELGEYDDEDGTFTTLPAKVPLGTALELLSKTERLPKISENTETIKRITKAVENHSERTLND